ncbi:hypothetical protein GCM10023322_83390 [Rugosimonospora acidiphila]|uniref:Tetrapyrrole methylase domain-containing protein n=1 Tax=Rugosimonospora acidiphila TaxID=556531 RepID=A0ABP9SVS1_9ACTN
MSSLTPLTDFLVAMASPENLDKFRSEPAATMRDYGLTDRQAEAVTSGERGWIRMEAVRELESAGLAPVITDKIDTDIGMIDPMTMNVSMNNDHFTTNSFNDFHSTTFNDNTHTSISDWREQVVLNIDDVISYFAKSDFPAAGSLHVVGSGIKPLSDLPIDARDRIKSADSVFYCVADPATEREIHTLNNNATSLYDLYGNDKPRVDTYHEMVDVILADVRAGRAVCAVFYGHPGIFAWSPHMAVKIARAEGYRAEMHPAISAQDSLFADLGIDPATCGLQTIDATEFLVHARILDTYSHVLVWQAECVGDGGFNFSGYSRRNFPILIERLLQFYPAEHDLIVYDASTLHFLPPRIVKTTVGRLAPTDLAGISTLYLPPIGTPPVDTAMLKRLSNPEAQTH